MSAPKCLAAAPVGLARMIPLTSQAWFLEPATMEYPGPVLFDPGVAVEALGPRGSSIS